MRNIGFSILILAACGATAWGQTENGHSGQGYVFFAPGSMSRSHTLLLHAGGGGEGLIFKGLGAGAEIGYLFPRWYVGDGIGLFSVNGSYHFGARTPGRKLVPFVTAGYSLAFRGGHANLANFGGGVHYWFTDRVGLRAEFRDHVWACSYCSSHLWGVRVGVAFR